MAVFTPATQNQQLRRLTYGEHPQLNGYFRYGPYNPPNYVAASQTVPGGFIAATGSSPGSFTPAA